MGHMKDFDRRIRQGGDDAIAAVSEYVKELEGEAACARACAEMMLQGTGQKLGEEWARRVMDEHYPPRWIPVGERLPEMGARVMVGHAVDGWVGIGERVLTGTYLHWEDDGEDLHEPTHWMPLPSPPGEAT